MVMGLKFVLRRIEIARLKMGFSEAEFSKLLGRPPSYYHLMRGGHVSLRVQDLFLIAKKTRHPITFFFPEQDSIDDRREGFIHEIIESLRSKEIEIRKLKTKLHKAKAS